MGIIESLLAEGVTPFDFDYMHGNTVDRITGDAPTGITGCRWSQHKSRLGIATKPGATDRINYGHSLARSLSGGAMSIMFFGNIGNSYNDTLNNRLISKRSVGSCSYDLFYRSTGILLYDGSATRTLTVSNIKGKTLCMTLVNGNPAKYYLDGSYIGAATNNSTVNDSSTSLYVGNVYDSTSPFGSIIHRVMGFSRVLTPAEISQLHQQLTAIKSDLRTRTRYIKANTQAIGTETLWLDFDTKVSGAASTLQDLSGNNRNAVLYQTGPDSGLSGNAVYFNGTSVSYGLVTDGYTNTLKGSTAASISVWVKLKPGWTAGTVLLSRDGVQNWFIAIDAGGTPRVYAAQPTGRTLNFANSPMQTDTWNHLYIEYTGAESLNLYLNNVLQVPSSGTIYSPPNSDGNLGIGCYLSGMTFNLRCSIDDLRIFPANLTVADRTKLYTEGAHKLALSVSEPPVTLANVVAPATIPKSEYYNWLGTASVVSSGGKRWLNAVSANLNLRVPCNVAFGTFYFQCQWESAGQTGFDIIANISTRAGYRITMYNDGKLYIQRINPNLTLLITTAVFSVSTPYEVVFARDSGTAKFTAWAKGGAMTNWTLLTAEGGANPTAAESTTTTCVALEPIIATAGSRIRGIKVFQGVVSPITNPEKFV